MPTAQTIPPLADDPVFRQVVQNRRWADGACFIYQWMFHFMRWSIPILSAILTGIAAVNQLPVGQSSVSAPGESAAAPKESPEAAIKLASNLDRSSKWIMVVGIVLTVLTILNAAVKPGDEFQRHAGFRTWFDDFKMKYEVGRNRIVAEHPDDPTLPQLLDDWRVRKNTELLAVWDRWNRGLEAPALEL